jgi:hypothetical protein
MKAITGHQQQGHLAFVASQFISALSYVGCQRVKIYAMFVHNELNKKPAFNTQCYV